MSHFHTYSIWMIIIPLSFLSRSSLWHCFVSLHWSLLTLFCEIQDRMKLGFTMVSQLLVLFIVFNILKWMKMPRLPLVIRQQKPSEGVGSKYFSRPPLDALQDIFLHKPRTDSGTTLNILHNGYALMRLFCFCLANGFLAKSCLPTHAIA